MNRQMIDVERGFSEPLVTQNSNSSSAISQKRATTTSGFRDPVFLVLFVVHFAVICYFAFTNGLSALNNLKDGVSDTTSGFTVDTDDAKKLGYAAASLAMVSVASAFAMLTFMISYGETMIRTVLLFNVAASLAFSIVAFSYQQIIPGVFFLFIAAMNYCYYRCVQRRIEFASANLKVACKAVQTHYSVVFVAFVNVLKSIVWTSIWVLCLYGVNDAANKNSNTNTDISDSTSDDISASFGMILFFLILSFYWVHEVIRNISHVATAGVVASWWYDNSSTSVVSGAYCRASTSSLGSIAFGSLIVAFIQALKSVAEKAKRNGSFLACIARCILSCFESIMMYFNRWAFVYVGIYGESFCTSGKAVTTMFKNRGFTAPIINDNLIQNTLTFASLIVGCLVASIGAITPLLTGDWLSGYENASLFLGGLGFVLGFVLSMIMMAVVDSAVATVFVCFAEAPTALENTHPNLYYDLNAAWRKAHSSIF